MSLSGARPPSRAGGCCQLEGTEVRRDFHLRSCHPASCVDAAPAFVPWLLHRCLNATHYPVSTTISWMRPPEPPGGLYRHTKHSKLMATPVWKLSRKPASSLCPASGPSQLLPGSLGSDAPVGTGPWDRRTDGSGRPGGDLLPARDIRVCPTTHRQ